MLFMLSKIVGAVVLPPVGPLLVALAGLMLMSRFRRAGRAMAFAGVASLLLLSVPLVSDALSWIVSDGRALAADEPVHADAIVVLGCGARTDAAEYGGDTLTSMSLERARYGAVLARRYRLPVAVSGGVVLRVGRPEADLIGEAMETEFGVPVRWRERESRNTHENATGLRDMLQPEGVRRVVLVSHGVDMRRARREFEAAGFDVTMAPTVIPTVRLDGFRDLVPAMFALRESYLALYEVLGNAKTSIFTVP